MSSPEDIVSLPSTPPTAFAAVTAKAAPIAAVSSKTAPAPLAQPDHNRKPSLTIKEIAEGLARRSTGLVDELHAISLRLLQGEDQRESRLDAKAQGLLVTAGLTLTVAFTFGGMLLGHPEYLSEVAEAPAVAIFVLYALAMGFGLLASVWAVRALKVTGAYRNTAERDVFCDKELTDADDACDEPQTPAENAKAVAMYRRYMTSHYWQLWQQNTTIHEHKATLIKRGQSFFLWFLSLMLVIGGILAFAALLRYYNPPPPCPK